MPRWKPILLAAVILVCGVAPSFAKTPPLTEEQRLQKALAGLVPGKPVDCIRQGPNVDSTTYDGAILYRDGGTRYLNRFGGSCNIRANWDIAIVHIFGSQLCRGDIARIVEAGTPIEKGSCVFGDFTPYKKVK